MLRVAQVLVLIQRAKRTLPMPLPNRIGIEPKDNSKTFIKNKEHIGMFFRQSIRKIHIKSNKIDLKIYSENNVLLKSHQYRY